MEEMEINGRNVGSIKLDRYKEKNIQPSIKLTKKVKPKEKKGHYKCVCCGKEYTTQKSNFIISFSVLYASNNGYVPICKSCAETFYNQMVEFYSGNEEHAIEHCCKVFDWYFSDTALKMARASSKPSESFLTTYHKKMGMHQVKCKGSTYMDTVRQEHLGKITRPADIPSDTDKGEVAKPSITPEIVEFFGFGYTDEEYEYLEAQYQDWTARYECKTKAQEELFRSVCIVQLSSKKAQQRGDTKAFIDLMKTFQDLLGTANLKPSQSSDGFLTEQNTYGSLIRKWEESDPIPEPDDEWKDVDGIYRYIDTYFLGHLCNLVHVENDHAKAYREEMDKYTVTPPEYEDEDAAETSLLDKYSDKGEKNDNF